MATASHVFHGNNASFTVIQIHASDETEASRDQTNEKSYTKMFKQLYHCDQIIAELKTNEHIWNSDKLREQGELHRTNITKLRQILDQTIVDLDFISVPSDSKLKECCEKSHMKAAEEFIKFLTIYLPQGKHLSILLIGKTGHGKSATANTILGRNCFNVSSNMTSVTKAVQDHVRDMNGRMIKVIDTPGIFDTDFEKHSDMIEFALQAFSEAVSRTREGFDALVLVFRYGQRMTTEEKKAIQYLKALFGADIIKKRCVCVFTYGDSFPVSESFIDWCKKQEEFIREVLEECNYRCILFNNIETSKTKNNKQVKQLIKMIDNMSMDGCGPYTQELFELMKEKRTHYVQDIKNREFDDCVERINAKLEETKVPNYLSDDDLKYLNDQIIQMKSLIKGNTKLKYKADTIDKLAQAVENKTLGQFELVFNAFELIKRQYEMEVEEINKTKSKTIFEHLNKKWPKSRCIIF